MDLKEEEIEMNNKPNQKITDYQELVNETLNKQLKYNF